MWWYHYVLKLRNKSLNFCWKIYQMIFQWQLILNTLCKYSPTICQPTAQIVWSLYFFFDPKKKVYHTTSVANGCSRLWLPRITPLVPPQARASARVLAKHVCQPKSFGCVVNVCCNWEIHVRIPLGWCGGAKEGLRNYEFRGCGIQLRMLQGSYVTEKMCSPLFTHKGSFRKKPFCLLSSPEGLVSSCWESDVLSLDCRVNSGQFTQMLVVLYREWHSPIVPYSKHTMMINLRILAQEMEIDECPVLIYIIASDEAILVGRNNCRSVSLFGVFKHQGDDCCASTASRRRSTSSCTTSSTDMPRAPRSKLFASLFGRTITFQILIKGKLFKTDLKGILTSLGSL